MDQKQAFKQMIDINQAAFNTAFSATVLLQDQFESIANKALDHVPDLSAERRKTIDNWSKAFKEGRKNFKQQIDSNFTQAEKLFT